MKLTDQITVTTSARLAPGEFVSRDNALWYIRDCEPITSKYRKYTLYRLADKYTFRRASEVQILGDITNINNDY